jgi:hypothetical protein
MERWAQEQRERAGADDGSHRSACRDVQRDDHAPIIAYARPAMSLGHWFRRLFSPSPSAASPEEAILREEYGGKAAGPSEPGVVADGISGFASLEGAEAVEDVKDETERRPDPAP